MSAGLTVAHQDFMAEALDAQKIHNQHFNDLLAAPGTQMCIRNLRRIKDDCDLAALFADSTLWSWFEPFAAPRGVSAGTRGA